MQALIFLAVRSFVNGVRRSLTSWKRLISLIGVGLYYFWLFIRPWQTVRPLPIPKGHLVATMPDLALIDSIVFTVFAIISLVLMIAVEQGATGFKPADVDVLFPTPISPKLVLGFRFIRDSLVTLLLPLFLAIVSFRPTAMGLQTFIQNFPSQGGYVIRAAVVAWLLLAVTWVSIRYAVGLSINRSDLQSDRNKKILSWSLGLGFLAFCVSLALQVPNVHSASDFAALTHELGYRVSLFSATFATQMVMAPLHGNWALLFLGAGGLAATSFVAFQIALAQTGTMYDQSTAKAFATRDRLAAARNTGMIGLMSDRARQGKLKAGKVRWYHRMNAPGPSALIWKEVVVQTRGGMFRFATLAAITLALSMIPLVMPDELITVAGALFMGMLAYLILLTCGVSSQSGILEMLRKVDFQKPLPLAPATIVFYEILGKTFLPTILNTAACLVAIAVKFPIWPWALSGLLVMPTLAIVVVSTNLVVMVMFPDIDDPTQRGFRGMMTLLGYIILAAPGVGVFALELAFGIHPTLAALLPMAINLGVSAGAAFVGGQLFASFNPSE